MTFIYQFSRHLLGRVVSPWDHNDPVYPINSCFIYSIVLSVIIFPWGCTEFPENFMTFPCTEKSFSIQGFPGLWPPCFSSFSASFFSSITYHWWCYCKESPPTGHVLLRILPLIWWWCTSYTNLLWHRLTITNWLHLLSTTLCLKKVPTFKLCNFVNLNRFSTFYTAGKHTKFAIKNIRSFPSHLDSVAALPWEDKSSNLLKITQDTTQKSYCIW